MFGILANELGGDEVTRSDSGRPIFNLDHDSIWLNRTTEEAGANVIDVNSGEIVHLKYRLQSIGNNAYKVCESINNSAWKQVGVIKRNMKLGDLGQDDTGGPFYAEIQRTILIRLMRRIHASGRKNESLSDYRKIKDDVYGELFALGILLDCEQKALDRASMMLNKK